MSHSTQQKKYQYVQYINSANLYCLSCVALGAHIYFTIRITATIASFHQITAFDNDNHQTANPGSALRASCNRYINIKQNET